MQLWNLTYGVLSTTVKEIEVRSIEDAGPGRVIVENEEVHDETVLVVTAT